MTWGEGWLQWGVIWRLGAIAALCLGFGYMLIRTLIPFDGSFEDQLLEAKYPNPKIETTLTSMGSSKTQTLYIGRSTFGKCLFRLERTQYENGYKLVEVNGRPLVIEGNPSREESVASAATIGITC
jgi:hypothetical protein